MVAATVIFQDLHMVFKGINASFSFIVNFLVAY